MRIIVAVVVIVGSECGKSHDGSKWSTEKDLEHQTKVFCPQMTGVRRRLGRGRHQQKQNGIVSPVGGDPTS